jgi:HK97 family phage major capsid protein
MMADLTVKMLGTNRVGGYLVVFGSPDARDLQGDYFTPETKFLLDWYDKRPVLYHHGLDGKLKTELIGAIDTLGMDDVGIWAEAQLDMHKRYCVAVQRLVDKGVLRWSSGSLSHLVERDHDGFIKVWPIVEGSLTPTPAEPRMTNVSTLKHLYAEMGIDFSDSPAGEDSLGDVEAMQAKTSNGASDTSGFNNISFPKGEDMSDETQNKPPVQPEGDVQAKIDASIKRYMESDDNPLRGEVKSLSDGVGKLLQLMEDEPAVRQSGYFTVDGGTADPEIKSLGDFMLAIVRNDQKRLQAVYGSSYKAQTSDSGAEGGYLIPHTFHNEIWQHAVQVSPILAGVNRIPVTSPVGTVPSYDYVTAPTAGSGDTADASGITTASRAEGGSYTETDLNLQQIKYSTNDAVSGLIKASKKMTAAVSTIESILRTHITIAWSSKLVYFILLGSGNAQPLGILNSPAVLDVSPTTNNVFKLADKSKMQARFKNIGNRGIWLAHLSMMEDLEALEVGSGGGAVWLQNIAGAQPPSLGGYPISYEEHLPQADASGCINLVDLACYSLFEFGTMYIDFSEHAAFNTGQDSWRFGQEIDGKPMVQGKITQASPGSAYEVSPFVRFND